MRKIDPKKGDAIYDNHQFCTRCGHRVWRRSPEKFHCVDCKALVLKIKPQPCLFAALRIARHLQEVAA